MTWSGSEDPSARDVVRLFLVDGFSRWPTSQSPATDALASPPPPLSLFPLTFFLPLPFSSKNPKNPNLPRSASSTPPPSRLPPPSPSSLSTPRGTPTTSLEAAARPCSW